MGANENDFGFEPLQQPQTKQDDFGFEPLKQPEEQPAGGVPAPIMSPEEAKAKGIPYLGQPTFSEQLAGLIPEPLAAGLEAYGRTFLPVVYQEYESLVGVPKAEQLRRAEENPLAAAAGSVGGLLGGLAVGSAGGAVSALSPFAKASMAAGAAIRGAVPAAAGGLAATAAGTAAGLAEGTLISGLMEADEARLRNRPIKTEAIVHNALISGGIGGFLAGAPAAGRWFGQSTKSGKKLLNSLGESSARRVLGKLGASESELKNIETQIGRDRTYGILSEAADTGLVDFFGSASRNLQRAESAMDDAGSAIGRCAQAGDDVIANAGSGAKDLAPDINKILERVSDEVVFPLSKRSASDAEAIANDLREYSVRYKNGMGIKDLNSLRKEIQDKIFGLRGTSDPSRNIKMQELRKIRNILTDEIGSSLERVGVKREAWRVPQRKYEVASRIEQLASDAAQAEASGAGGSAGEKLVKLLASAAGFSRYGAKGVLLGPPAAVAKSAWSDMTAWAPTATRRFLGAGAPPEVALELQQYAEKAAQAMRSKVPPPPVSTWEQARLEQLKIKNSLLAAVDEIKSAPDPSIYDPKIVERLEQISNEFKWGASRSADTTAKMLQNTERALTDLSRAGESIAEMPTFAQGPVARRLEQISASPAAGSALEAAGTARLLEETERSLTGVSRMGAVGKIAPAPIRTSVGAPEFKQDPAVEVARRVRDEIRASLAQPEIFGQAYRDAAELRALQASGAIKDPAHMATLEGLEEVANNLRRRIETGADKLMGYGASVVKQQEAIKERARRPLIEISYKEAQREREEAERRAKEQPVDNVEFVPEASVE